MIKSVDLGEVAKPSGQSALPGTDTLDSKATSIAPRPVTT